MIEVIEVQQRIGVGVITATYDGGRVIDMRNENGVIIDQVEVTNGANNAAVIEFTEEAVRAELKTWCAENYPEGVNTMPKLPTITNADITAHLSLGEYELLEGEPGLQRVRHFTRAAQYGLPDPLGVGVQGHAKGYMLAIERVAIMYAVFAAPRYQWAPGPNQLGEHQRRVAWGVATALINTYREDDTETENAKRFHAYRRQDMPRIPWEEVEKSFEENYRSAVRLMAAIFAVPADYEGWLEYVAERLQFARNYDDITRIAGGNHWGGDAMDFQHALEDAGWSNLPGGDGLLVYAMRSPCHEHAVTYCEGDIIAGNQLL